MFPAGVWFWSGNVKNESVLIRGVRAWREWGRWGRHVRRDCEVNGFRLGAAARERKKKGRIGHDGGSNDRPSCISGGYVGVGYKYDGERGSGKQGSTGWGPKGPWVGQC